MSFMYGFHIILVKYNLTLFTDIIQGFFHDFLLGPFLQRGLSLAAQPPPPPPLLVGGGLTPVLNKCICDAMC